VRRWLLNFAAVVSFALCVAMCALWLRSYWYYDRVVWNSAPDGSEAQLHLGAESNLDTIAIGYVDYRPPAPRGVEPPFTPGYSRSVERIPPNTPNGTRRFVDTNGFQFAGFGFFQWAISPPYSSAGYRAYNYGLIFPHWSLALVSGAVAAWRGWHVLRRRRNLTENRCLGCGYDLRATPERCPECGAEVKPQRAEGAPV